MDSMDTVGFLARFAFEHSTVIDDEIDAIVESAAKRLPHITDLDHRRAARVVRESFMELDAAAERQVEMGRREQNDSDKAERTKILRRMEAEVEKIAGSSSASMHYFHAVMRQRSRPRRAPLLRSSLLISAVANFEVLVAAQLRFFFKVRPEAMRSKDQSYSIEEISKHLSIEEFLSSCGAKRADGILRESFESWMDWLQKRVGAGVNECADEIIVVAEVFQRRHLFVHNGGVVNSLYLSNVKGKKGESPEIGERLSVDAAYLASAIENLTILGTILTADMLAIYGADGREKQSGYRIAQDYVFESLVMGSDSLVVGVCGPAALKCGDEYLRLVFQVNLWVAKKRMNGPDSVEDEVRAWQVSALAPTFSLAKHALLDENERALELANEMRASGALGEEEWLTWPLLEAVRQVAVAELEAKEGKEEEGSVP